MGSWEVLGVDWSGLICCSSLGKGSVAANEDRGEWVKLFERQSIPVAPTTSHREPVPGGRGPISGNRRLRFS